MDAGPISPLTILCGNVALERGHDLTGSSTIPARSSARQHCGVLEAIPMRTCFGLMLPRPTDKTYAG